MYVTGLDGESHKFVWSKYIVRKRRKKSTPHKKALSLLLKMFSDHPIYEEVALPGSKTPNNGLLSADLFLPQLPLFVEIHGSQHYEFNPFFHRSQSVFKKSKLRDRNKIAWAKLNSLPIVILPYDRESEWEFMILKTIGA